MFLLKLLDDLLLSFDEILGGAAANVGGQLAAQTGQQGPHELQLLGSVQGVEGFLEHVVFVLDEQFSLELLCDAVDHQAWRGLDEHGGLQQRLVVVLPIEPRGGGQGRVLLDERSVGQRAVRSASSGTRRDLCPTRRAHQPDRMLGQS